MKPNKKKSPPVTGVRERLLSAAVTLFAERGFAGTAVDEIVGKAGANKRMVYHYFGDKEGIYRAALVEVFSQLAEVELQVVRAGEPAGTLVAQMVRSYFAFLEQHPEFVRFLLWENLQGGRAAEGVSKALYKGRFIGELKQALRRGVESGDFDSGLDPRHLLVQIIGLCLVYFSNRYTLKHTVGLDFSKSRTLSDGLDHIQHLLSHGMKPSRTNT